MVEIKGLAKADPWSPDLKIRVSAVQAWVRADRALPILSGRKLSCQREKGVY